MCDGRCLLCCVRVWCCLCVSCLVLLSFAICFACLLLVFFVVYYLLFVVRCRCNGLSLLLVVVCCCGLIRFVW